MKTQKIKIIGIMLMTALVITSVVGAIGTSAFSKQTGHIKNQTDNETYGYNHENETEHMENYSENPYQQNNTEPPENETEHMENYSENPYQQNITEPLGNNTGNETGGYENETNIPDNETFYQNCPPITQEELAAGWYYGELSSKKPGTPDTWIHGGEGTKSAMWFDPSLIHSKP